jgi:hypothetical protein
VDAADEFAGTLTPATAAYCTVLLIRVTSSEGYSTNIFSSPHEQPLPMALQRDNVQWHDRWGRPTIRFLDPLVSPMDAERE